MKEQSKNLMFGILAMFVVGFAVQAFAAGGTAVAIPMMDNLAATIKESLDGKISLVVDGVVLIVSAYASAIMKTPAPLIFGIISCVIFHGAIKLFLA